MENDKLEKVLSDENFVKEILNMQSTEEVQKAFEEKSVKLTIEEIQLLFSEISRQIKEMQELKNEPVSDAELENIAGGTTNSLKQFAQGFTSGHFGPAYAYSDIKKPFGDTEPTSKRQRIARYAGIACGTVVGLGGYGAGWIYGTFLAQFHTNHKLKEELRKKK